jgi:cytoskeletal protein RodZ
MVDFKKNKIAGGEESAGSRLRARREQKQLTLEESASKLNIKREYLTALEADEYEKLPGGVYEKTFLKKYTAFLGLDYALLENPREKNKTNRRKKSENIFTKKITAGRELLVFPKILRNFLIILLILALFFYLGFYLENSLSRPQIKIYSPADNLFATSSSVEVTGKTSPKTEVSINNELISKDDTGYFRKTIDLKKGVNEITISAQNRHGQKEIIKKQILVK